MSCSGRNPLKPLRSPPFQTEQIRRTNRLYASDSLFSKPYLMIPVSKGSPYYPSEATENQRPHSMPLEPQRISASSMEYNPSDGPWDPLQAPFYSPPGPSSSSSFPMDWPSTSSSSSTSAAATPAVRPEELSPEEEHKKDLDELLGKIDSTIANSRRFVAKSQDSREYADVQGNDATDGGVQMDYDGAYQNANATTGGHNRNASGSSFHTSDDLSGLITNSRQVKNSLQRLERTQDELFEL